ncbi:MAG: RNA ligase family protein [Magnetococcus sp. YQC-3]
MENEFKKILHQYPSTEQFNNVIRAVKYKTNFNGLDSEGNPTYDPTKQLPILNYLGSVKIHGTNGSMVRYNIDKNNDSQYYCQSRNQVLNPGFNDNCGFAKYISELPQEVINVIFKNNTHINMTVCGEWAGKSIQNGVGISRVDKSFFIFGISLNYEENKKEWINDLRKFYNEQELEFLNNYRIFNIFQFPYFELNIDFNNPQLVQNKLIELTEAVEKECPVAKYFGFSNEIGEGLVWKCNDSKYSDSDFWFKVKGEKHSASRVKKLASVDLEKINSVKEFVEYSVTENRLKQGLENIPGLDLRYTGDFIRWCFNDIIKEEDDTIIENKIDKKLIGGEIAKVAKKWFFDRIRES